MPKRKYTLIRESKYIETWEVIAESEEEAIEAAGEVDPTETEFIIYLDDEFTVEQVEDELVTFIKQGAMDATETSPH